MPSTQLKRIHGAWKKELFNEQLQVDVRGSSHELSFLSLSKRQEQKLAINVDWKTLSIGLYLVAGFDSCIYKIKQTTLINTTLEQFQAFY